MKVTAKTHAFVTKDCRATPEEMRTERGVNQMHFFSCRDGWEKYGYTYIGPAEVTVEVPDLRELVENKVAALREEAANLRAETTAKCTAIETQIQNLLAIEYTSAPEAQPE